MGYFTVKKETSFTFEEKKSTFIGNVKRIYSEDEAREFINKIRNENKEARHNVYAYIIGENKGIQRYSDDGEPQGTAGIPVLEVIKKNDITDVVVVVTRYFGGILLGTGGLVRAYSKAASGAVKESEVIEKVKGFELNISIEYDLFGKLQYLCSENSWYMEDVEYSDKVRVIIFGTDETVNEIKNNVLDLSSGKAVTYVSDEKTFFRSEGRLFYEIS